MPLNTKKFINLLIKHDYTHLCVVPCSFSKNVINESINNNNIEYLPAASEAIACSIAAGLKMSGKKPIVIIQSSGLSNMVSCITSLLKPYGVTFPILVSWRTYSEGDSEIQHKHLSKELPNLISSLGYQKEILDSSDLINSINQINSCNEKYKICIIEKNTFDKVELYNDRIKKTNSKISRVRYLSSLNDLYKNKDILFIGTTGHTSREMFKFMPNTNNFYMAGNMGGALSIGFGAAKSGRNVIVCGGDAEFVMHMGGLTTVGRDADEINLTYILFDNGQNKSTGGQDTYQDHLNYIGIAENAGFQVFRKPIDSIDQFKKALKEINKLTFIHVKCSLDHETPRPPLKAVKLNKFS
tara:strand:- start:1602 stop:2666 length:1065 start_codon:yes stop_codon:yes gene_type:complete